MHLSELEPRLRELEESNLLRSPDDGLVRGQLQERWGADFIDACSNDYLGLTQPAAPPSVQALDVSRETRELPSGAGASRLVFGTHPEHLAAEHELASWMQGESALLFSSGYAANVGALGALLSKDDAVFSDALNHASLIDGMRLSGARVRVVPHLDLGALEEQLKSVADAPARWVVVESYYSMDGDGPDLPRLQALCAKYQAHLYVDEAHSIGTFGPEGRGLCAAQGVRPDVLMLAFGKAFGAQGACVVGSERLRTWLWNRARSFVFSTALSPVLAGVLREQLRRVKQAEAERRRLRDLCFLFRQQLLSHGVELPDGGFGPIVSVVLGSAGQALAAAERLRAQGILAQAIRPPTVPEGKSRLRVVLHANLEERAVVRLSEAVLEVLRKK